MKKVLLVDNDILFLKEFCRTLSSMDYSVCYTENGMDAIKFLDREQFDLVITNLFVPFFNGNDVARHVRLVRKKQVFIIGISENPWLFNQDEFDRVVSRSISTGALMHAINGMYI